LIDWASKNEMPRAGKGKGCQVHFDEKPSYGLEKEARKHSEGGRVGSSFSRTTKATRRRSMKKALCIVACLFTLCVFCTAALADGEKATKEECVTKVKEVAKLAQEKGVNFAIEAVMAPKSAYVWKDSYVFIVDVNGKVLAHPTSPKMVGQNAMGWKDSNGKLYVAEYVQLGKEKGEGWVEFMWVVYATKDIKPKQCFVYRAPGTDALILAGVYVN
jgi:signal transduction histidine kinase